MRRSRPTWALAAITIAGCFLGSALAGCGHKASDADCRVIIDRMIEVRLDARKVMDPEAREREKQDMRGPGSGIDTKDCVGRRITDGQLECVKSAKSEDEITSCLR